MGDQQFPVDNGQSDLLLTPEQQQQQDLLQHLITHLHQPIVVCGPTGIGKTSLLNNWQAQQAAAYRFSPIHCHAALRLESVLDIIDQPAKQSANPKSYRNAVITLSEEARAGKKRVVILDNAGDLIPGLANEIIEFSLNRQSLSVIFVLSHDDLYLKNITDNLLDNCYLIEIPPLTEQQCGDFLVRLVAKRRLGRLGNAIDERYIANVYQQTHGIPGRIVAMSHTGHQPKRTDNFLWQLGAAIIFLVAIALALQWFSQKHNGLQIVLPFYEAAQPQAVPLSEKIQ